MNRISPEFRLLEFLFDDALDAKKVERLSPGELEKEMKEAGLDRLPVAKRVVDSISAMARDARLDAFLSAARTFGVDTGKELAGADLSLLDLSRQSLAGSELTGTDFTRADLRGIDLSGAHLENAVLGHADLSDANLSDAHLAGANLSGARLVGARLVGVTARGASFAGARLEEADLSDADLSEADLTGTACQGAVFTGTTLTGTILPEGGVAGLMSGEGAERAGLSPQAMSRAAARWLCESHAIGPGSGGKERRGPAALGRLERNSGAFEKLQIAIGYLADGDAAPLQVWLNQNRVRQKELFPVHDMLQVCVLLERGQAQDATTILWRIGPSIQRSRELEAQALLNVLKAATLSAVDADANTVASTLGEAQDMVDAVSADMAAFFSDLGLFDSA